MSGALAIYGTDEPPVAWRRVAAGRLSFDWEAGAVRNVRVDGLEVLRGIAFLVRDAGWGTVPATLADLRIERDGDTARVACRAKAQLPPGAFAWRLRLLATPSGLKVHAEGAADAELLVNRVGFVVLHPLHGVAGSPVLVEHGDGGREMVAIPAAIAPDQPVFDVAALTHWPAPGLAVRVALRGDAFEMEDQRNWSDASFKTYVRPLSRPRPFRLAPGERVAQSVQLSLEGPAPRRSPSASNPDLVIGAAGAAMPAIALAVDAAERADPARIAALAPQWLLLRLDSASPDLSESLARAARLVARTKARLLVDMVIDGRDPPAELAVLAASGLAPRAVLPIARRDLRSRPSRQLPPGEASAGDIARAARAAFPGALIGGGVRGNFAELNRNPPDAASIDFLAHGTSAIVHAADDRSVIETLEALPHVIGSARALAPRAAYWLGPCTIGMAGNPYGDGAAANPHRRRVVAAARDPRHQGLFGAAWAVGVLERASQGGVATLSFGHADGDFGLLLLDGTPTALGHVAQLAATASARARRHATCGPGIAAVAWQGARGAELLIANLTPETRAVRLGAGGGAWLLARGAHGWGWSEIAPGPLQLGPYAVARAAR